jgi:hypothetical protein
METAIKFIGAVTFALLVAAFVAFLGGYPTMWLVNYLFTAKTIEALFGIAQLTFWKAFWLNYLCASLFKGSAFRVIKQEVTQGE